MDGSQRGTTVSTDHRVAMLGTGLIGDFYTMTLHGRRSRDRVEVVYSRSVERGEAFKRALGRAQRRRASTTAVDDPAVDTVVVGLPNDMHEEAIAAAAAAGKAVLCTKPLARTADGGQADPRPRRVGGRLRRLSRRPRLHPEDAEGAGRRCAPGRSATCCGCAAGRPTPVRTAPGSGMPTRPAAAASSTSAATASRSSAATSARATVRSR